MEAIVRRWYRPAAVGLTVAFGLMAVGIAEAEWREAVRLGVPGQDFFQYLEATRRWIAVGTPYVGSEVAAPFIPGPTTFLHPPVALPLFAAFLLLPAVLWWAVPIGTLTWALWSWRPAPWTWPIIAAVLMLPRGHIIVIFGNSDLWVLAVVAAGLRFGWPTPLIAIKPSLWPLMLVGVGMRDWWSTAAVVVVAGILFGPLWLDWLAVIRHSPMDWTYSLSSLPVLALPFVAWAGRTRPVRPVPNVARFVRRSPIAGSGATAVRSGT